jgi:hypothetical protein
VSLAVAASSILRFSSSAFSLLYCATFKHLLYKGGLPHLCCEMKRGTPANKPCGHAGTSVDKGATDLNAVGQYSNVQRSTPDLVAKINVFPVLDHLLDGEHVILADSTEKSGCCLNVGGFAPFAFVDRVKTSGNTLSAGIFLDEPAEFIS